MKLASILQTKGNAVVTASPDMLIAEVVALLHRHRIGAVLVMDGPEIAGVVSERDIVNCLHTAGSNVLDSPVAQVMTTPVVTLAPDDTVESAMSLMTERRFRHLPVVSAGRLLGIVSIGDLVKNRISEIEQEAEMLKTFIQTA